MIDKEQEMDRDKLNNLSRKIIGMSIDIHKKLGPGFVEKIYEKALIHEFDKQEIKFINQAVVKVKYDNLFLGNQRIDFLVEDEIIVEIKAVSELNEIHEAQMRFRAHWGLVFLRLQHKKRPLCWTGLS